MNTDNKLWVNFSLTRVSQGNPFSPSLEEITLITVKAHSWPCLKSHFQHRAIEAATCDAILLQSQQLQRAACRRWSCQQAAGQPGCGAPAGPNLGQRTAAPGASRDKAKSCSCLPQSTFRTHTQLTFGNAVMGTTVTLCLLCIRSQPWSGSTSAEQQLLLALALQAYIAHVLIFLLTFSWNSWSQGLPLTHCAQSALRTDNTHSPVRHSHCLLLCRVCSQHADSTQLLPQLNPLLSLPRKNKPYVQQGKATSHLDGQHQDRAAGTPLCSKAHRNERAHTLLQEQGLPTCSASLLTVSILWAALGKHSTLGAAHICFSSSTLCKWEALLAFSTHSTDLVHRIKPQLFPRWGNSCRALTTKPCCTALIYHTQPNTCGTPDHHQPSYKHPAWTCPQEPPENHWVSAPPHKPCWGNNAL